MKVMRTKKNKYFWGEAFQASPHFEEANEKKGFFFVSEPLVDPYVTPFLGKTSATAYKQCLLEAFAQGDTKIPLDRSCKIWYNANAKQSE